MVDTPPGYPHPGVLSTGLIHGCHVILRVDLSFSVCLRDLCERKDDEGRQGQRSGGANGNAGDECLFQSLGVWKQDVRKRYWTRVDQTHEKREPAEAGSLPSST